MSLALKVSRLLRPAAVAARWLAHSSIALLLLLAPATSCHAAPDNPLIGTWTLTADGTDGKLCGDVVQKLTFTAKSSQSWNNQGRTGGPVLISYVVELPNVFVTSSGNNVTYTVSGSNIIWRSAYGPCTYSRA